MFVILKMDPDSWKWKTYMTTSAHPKMSTLQSIFIVYLQNILSILSLANKVEFFLIAEPFCIPQARMQDCRCQK